MDSHSGTNQSMENPLETTCKILILTGLLVLMIAAASLMLRAPGTPVLAPPPEEAKTPPSTGRPAVIEMAGVAESHTDGAAHNFRAQVDSINRDASSPTSSGSPPLGDSIATIRSRQTSATAEREF